MEHLLPGMEPPKRSEQEKKKSLQVIEQHLTNKKRHFNIPYFSVLAAAVAVLYILIASLQTSQPTLEPSSAAATHPVKNIYLFDQNELYDGPRTTMTKWYNLDKLKLSEEEIRKILPFLERQQHVPGEIQTTLSENYLAFIVQYENGVEHFFKVDFLGKQIINASTNAVAEIDSEEYWIFVDLENDLHSNVSFIIEILLLLFGYAIYMNFLQKLSPIRKLKLEERNIKVMRQFFKGVGFYFGLALVVSLSQGYYNAQNLLFIISFYTLFMLLLFFYRRFIKKELYSYYEIPVSIFAYTCFALIFSA